MRTHVVAVLIHSCHAIAIYPALELFILHGVQPAIRVNYLPQVSGKRNKVRKVPLNNTVRSILRQYLESAPTASVYVFVGQKGERIGVRALQKLIAKYGRLARVDDLSPHDLRHRFGYRMAQKTRLDVLAQLMGHESVNITKIYTQPTAEDLQEAVDRIAWE